MINNRGNTAVRSPKDLEPIRPPMVTEYYLEQAKAKRQAQPPMMVHLKKFPAGRVCWGKRSCWEATRTSCPVALSCSKAYQNEQNKGLSLEEQVVQHLKTALKTKAKAVLKEKEIETLLSLLEAKTP